MGGSPIGLGNFILHQRTADEMSRMRQLQQQKAQMPPATVQHEIQNNNQALVMWPSVMMATKKVLLDQQRDPGFRAKWVKSLQTYQAQGEGILGNARQQMFFNTPEDQTSKDLIRYFNITGRFYGMSLPSITAGTGLRGQYVAKLFDPHIPNYDRTPQQTWERTKAIKPSLVSRYQQMIAHPLYRQFVQQDMQGAMSTRHQWRQQFSPEEWDYLSPGIFKNRELPAGAVKLFDNTGKVTKYRSLEGKDTWSPEDVAAMEMKTPVIPGAFHATERPSPLGRGTTIIPSRLGVPSVGPTD